MDIFACILFYALIGVLVTWAYTEIVDCTQDDSWKKLIALGTWWPFFVAWWMIKGLVYLFWYSTLYHIVKLFKKKG